jgi:TusA-related sulfurtransferase
MRREETLSSTGGSRRIPRRGMHDKNRKGVDSMQEMVLDIRGQICPACLLVTLKEIHSRKESLRSREAVLLVRTDHRDATRTIPDTASAMGYHVDVSKVKNYYEIRLEYRDGE